MMLLRWTTDAVQDHEDIYNHIEVDNPDAVLALDEWFETNAGWLIARLEMGRFGRASGTRELVVHQKLDFDL